MSGRSECDPVRSAALVSDEGSSARDYLLTSQRKWDAAVVNENAAIISFEDAAKQLVDASLGRIEIFPMYSNSVNIALDQVGASDVPDIIWYG